MCEKPRSAFLHLLLIGVLVSSASAQPDTFLTHSTSRLKFDRIGLGDGLPNASVNCIVQDRFGFMWFGTKDGLCRYDGQKFKTYKSIPGDSTSIAGNDVQALFADSRGMLWVGANGLQRFNFEQENFTRIAPPNFDSLASKLKFITAMCEDNTGALWLGTFGQGLFKFNPRSGDVQHVEAGVQTSGPFGSKLIFALSTDGSDTIWVSSGGHQVTALNSRTLEQRSYSLTQKGDIQKVFADRAGRLWLGAIGEPLKRMHLQMDGEVRFTRFESVKPANFISCFRDDRNGSLWIGTQLNGLYVLHPEKHEIQFYRQNSRDVHSLPGAEILDIYEDRSGNIWIATNRGVAKWARWKKPFRHFTHDTESANSINNAEVTGIDQDVNGNLWISTLNAGFCKFDPRTENFTRFDPSTCAIKSPWAIEILADLHGVVWIATNFQHGLNRFAVSAGRFKEFLHNPKDTTTISSNLITTLYMDRRGRIWLGPAFKGLNLYEPGSESFTRFKHDPTDSTTLSHNNVLAIYEDQQGTVWIGTSDGFNRFDPEDLIFTRYYAEETARHQSESFEVYSMLDDAQQRFWLGTNRGLYLFDRQSHKFEHIIALTELVDGRIFGILNDAGGNLWLQTTTALIKFDSQQRRLRSYDRNDGWMQSVVYEQEWRHAYDKLDSGELVFGGSNGITIFHPDSIRDNPEAPPIRITGFGLFYEPVEFDRNPEGRRATGDSLLTRSLLFTDHLRLRHSERTFSFDFAALDFTQAQANAYAYMLEGLHDDWVYCGNERTATFINVPPGDYTFRVKGANSDGLWNEDGAAISISIMPPWWKTTAAYLGYAALLLALIFAARRYELNRIKMRNQLRMQEFEAQKLHEVDRMKSRFFANISHEFRTPLTLILGPLEEVIAKVKDAATQGELRIMQRNANRLLRLINQLLDLSRLEAGRMELRARRDDIAAFIKGIVMSFASLAEQKKIVLQFEEAQELKGGAVSEIYFDHDKIEKIFYNLLSNALKFTPEGGRVEVRVGEWENGRVRERESGRVGAPSLSHPLIDSGFLQITITDTGIGIPADRLPHIFDRFYQVDSSGTREHEGTGIGLALTKDLIERHYGKIEVQSEINRGTTFIIRLPRGKQHLKPDEIVDGTEQLPVALDHAPVTSDQQPAAGDQQPATSDQPIILVVEDHDDVRHYVRNHLTQDYQVIEAKDGSEGAAIALESIPDLIISDVMMPQLDGYQLCAAIKTNEKTSHIPVILLTAKAGEEDKLAGLETGADDYLVKPFNSKELHVRVKNLIDLRRKLRERFRRQGLLSPREIAVPSVEEAFLQKLMQVMQEHLGEENFGVDDLSAALAIGRKQLYRKIKALAGQTPTDFIRTVRLQRAKQLLEQHAGTVSEIAYQVGFNNLSYFSKCFKEEFGELPSEIHRPVRS